MTPQELRRLVNDTLVAAGFTKHFKSWMLAGEEVSWIVSLDKRPSTLKYALRLGGHIHSISGDAPPHDSNNCQIILFFKDMGPRTGYGHDNVAEAFDLRSELDDDERESRIRGSISAAARFMQDRTTVEALRHSFNAGELIGFVLKDARALFENAAQ